MLDIKMIREETDTVRRNIERRGDPEKNRIFDELLKADKEHRALLHEEEKLRMSRNSISQEIAELVRSKKDASAKKAEAANIPERLKALGELRIKAEEKTKSLLLRVPNLLHDSVPVGKEEKDNVVVRTVGKPPKFGFTPKTHLEIIQDMGMIDAERAAKVAGHGFYYLKGELVLLDYAIMRFALDSLMKKGFTVIEPPYMLQRRPYEGVTDVADFENVMYKLEGQDMFMIATSEHPMAAMRMDETLLKDELPIKLCGISPCFRKEVGAHGKYTHGLFRMHQFNKVEQFVFCLPENSWKVHEELQKNAEELYQKLGLHYRVVNV